MDLDRKAAELKGALIPFCWATVVRCRGSAPREAGAKMIATPDGSFGTIGGGALEQKVIADAREAIRRRRAVCETYPLGPLLGQCCGGEVEVFLDPVIPPRAMYVFGAGHIAEKLLPMLAEIGFAVTLIDEREERIALPCFAGAADRWNELPGDALRRIRFDGETHVIVITHEHRHDEEIVRFCLDKPFRYLGCIGSRTKWAKFKARYRAKGHADEELERVQSPIGLDIGAETPFEIAVAIVAALIQMGGKPGDYEKGVGHFS